ncbi:MAG: hypothetical protein ABI685_00765 [Ferruginibacter sp.]
MTIVFLKSIEALNSLVHVLVQLPRQNSYSVPCNALSHATIGQHTRHIIELYQCLIAGYVTGEVNYDNRKRDMLLENDIAAAVDAVKEIQLNLQQEDKTVKIFCEDADNSVCIESNYYREVLYNLEHCIHHQALIKVALLSIKDIQIADSFGVAPSTLQYRQQCAQ